MKLACKDLDPTTACDFEAHGNTKTEVAGKMFDHAKMEHADKIGGMNMSEGEVVKMFESKVRE
ncbi:MAG: hypothetical protein RJA61_703 [Candidatus Parcubacteria bacterium]|jgi:predicted small metal-binding protein